ncbi:MAG: RhuM family protein, partial [Polyangiaceae bacterium]
YMADWIAKLDDFLKLSEREILRHAGKVSHDHAIAKAETEYDRFVGARAALPAPVEKHFEDAVHEVKQLEKGRGRSTGESPRGRKPTKR